MPDVKMIAKLAIGVTLLVVALMVILAPFMFAMAHPAIAIVLAAAVIGAAAYVIRRKRHRNLV